MHRIATRIRAVAALAVAALLSGCSTTPNWDRHFGEATRVALARQVLHPAAGQNRDPVAGLDGAAAAAVRERYLKSYTEPPPPASFTIGVGGAK